MKSLYETAKNDIETSNTVGDIEYNIDIINQHESIGTWTGQQYVDLMDMCENKKHEIINSDVDSTEPDGNGFVYIFGSVMLFVGLLYFIGFYE